MGLPINIEDLLTGETVEWERIEFKEGWNPLEVTHSICAYANDINNWGGGYIILGIRQENGRPILPPKGLTSLEIENIQHELMDWCHRLHPNYFPIAEPIKYQGKMILVLWAYGGPVRPYKAPDGYKDHPGGHSYYVRRFSSTTKADDQEERDLLNMSANIPYDDQTQQRSDTSDLKLPIIQEYLKNVDSSLYAESESMPFISLCRRMNIIDGPDEYVKPKNIGLLMFSDDPTRYFSCAQIDIVEFENEAGDVFTEKIFKGPIHHQLQNALIYIKNRIILEKIIKIPGVAESRRFFNYPYTAIEEALVNTVYHRSYQDDSPIEVRIYPNKIEMLSYPGPLPPLNKEKLKSGDLTPRKYRNRRIGDFLKELHLTEGRGTGIPTIRLAMAKNGSPEAIFETDDNLSYFRAILPIHPESTISSYPTKVQASVQGGVQARLAAKRIQDYSIVEVFVLDYCLRPKKRREILGELGVANRQENYTRYIKPLIEKGWITLTIPDKITHENQQYRTSADGSKTLSRLKGIT